MTPEWKLIFAGAKHLEELAFSMCGDDFAGLPFRVMPTFCDQALKHISSDRLRTIQLTESNVLSQDLVDMLVRHSRTLQEIDFDHLVESEESHSWPRFLQRLRASPLPYEVLYWDCIIHQ